MSRPNDPGYEPSPRHDTVEELNALLSNLCDEVTTAEDRRRLNQILEGSQTARRYYLKQIAIHSALVTTAGSYVRPELGNRRYDIERAASQSHLGRPSTSAAAGEMLQLDERGKFVIRSVRTWSSVAVVLCFIGLVAVWSNYGRRQSERSTGAKSGNASTIALAPNTKPLVAEVTYVSPEAGWQNPNASYALGARIGVGHSLVLEHGQLELTYNTGTRLLLTGPSEFWVEPTGGKLRRGELLARVPEAGHGFTIETPHGKVIDLGTEFGVVVDDFGVSQVSVFEGKVETLPIGVADASPNKIELTSGRALQWTGKAIIPLDAKGRRYFRPGDEAPAEMRPAKVTTASFDERFRGESLRVADWKTIGTVIPTTEGLQLGDGIATDPKPYLISRQEFDPSEGAITVICDVRFAETADIGAASFAILTRSDQQQSEPGSPWHDMMARCLRCSFGVDAVSGDGILEAGTKYEPDRELTNIFWGGFSRPQPGTRYRLEMHDDGLNVTFTVSLTDNPSVRKTINCRSLFRGNHNFIALEGPRAGTAVVERLQIRQELPPETDGGQHLDRESMLGRETFAVEAAYVDLVEKLIPADAVVLVKDDFDDGELDSNIWSTLGDVVAHDGQMQLGVANETQHIDTWRQRPYLLTKQQFDSADGALIVVGKVEFAENFLHGYGGSFAVMTRADDTHGNGPGWENSILRRGLRANFWPAALGFEHSLEIHEKPAPNTISLLAAEGFPINPRSRSYYFRVVDRGESAVLTFIDAEKPLVQKTITHQSTIHTFSRGHIAFESCWGSPTLLDDVRILRSRIPSAVGTLDK